MKKKRGGNRKIVSSLKDIIDLVRAFWKSKILFVANELDVFNKLSDSSKTAQELSKVIKTDPQATELLLNALVAMGLLKKNGYQCFSNTTISRKYLCQYSSSFIGFALRHYNFCWEAWSDLESIIRSGHLIRFVEREGLYNNPNRAKDFSLLMDYSGWSEAEEISKIVKLDNVNKMLDLGGGSGCYSIVFTKKFPFLNSTIFDLPLVIDFTKKNIKKYNIENRIKTIKGNFFESDLGKNYDLVFLSHILHSFGELEISLLLRKAYQSLRSGGHIIVHDFMLGNNGTFPLEASIFAILMIVNTDQGRTYNLSEIKRLLRQAGFNRIYSKKVPEKSEFILRQNPYLIGGYK